LEQQRGTGESKAVELERNARKEVEGRFLAELQAKQDDHSRLQIEMQRLQSELASQATEAASLSVSHAQSRAAHEENTADLRKQIDGLSTAKSAAETELSTLRQEMSELESEVVRAQTELTMAKAELDGAYGTRAQRAADVSMNPAVQKEFDGLAARNGELESQMNLLRKEHEAKDVDSVQLQNKVAALQRELRETIEEYEVMTKQSIDDEKERERLEENVDAIQRRCEDLENQLNEERVKSLGSRVSSPTETTSTMVLRNEFRKMMRDTRAENLKVLKVSLSFSDK
jgi:chromosome segregation ATPase